MPRSSANGRELATNLFPQSDAMSASPWSATNMTGAGGQSDPFGGSNATLWTESTDGGAANHYVAQPTTVLAPYGGWQIVSWYAKASGRGFSGLRVGNGVATAIYDLSALSVTLGGTSTGNIGATSIEDVGSGWRRCSALIRAYGTSTTEAPRIYSCSSTAGITYLGTGLAAIYTFGGMAEIPKYGQTTPSPYVATAAGTATVPREARQNWLRYSDDVSQTSGWTRTRLSSITTDGTLQPNGVAMQKVAEDATASATHQLSQTTASNLDKARFRTYYAILKAGSRTFACLALDGGNQGAMFDLSNGTIGQNNMVRGGSASIASLGDGCYLCSITGDVLGGSSQQCNLYLATSSLFTGLTYSGNGSGYIYVGQTGVVCGSGPVDHITTTAAVANASGAPRSLAGARTAAGSRTAA